MNKKQVIRLNESQINQIVTESVKNILSENALDNIKGAWQGMKSGYQSQQSHAKANRNIEQKRNNGYEPTKEDVKKQDIAYD